MARGWESKSVESQQSVDLGAKKRRVPAEEAERAAKKAGLELSRGRVMRELETARSEVHRTALENALKFLEEELAKLA
jgi:hypothetical protein